MDDDKGFVWRWSDVLSSIDSELALVHACKDSFNYYSYASRCQKHYLKFPYEHVYLTPREMQTALQLLQCKTMRQAAVSLNLSHRTIEFYLKSIKKKLCCFKKKLLLQILDRVIDR